MRLFILFVSLVVSIPALADTTIVSLNRDTVYARYMTRGAWTKPLFSKERLALTDSALKYLPHDAYLWQQRSMPLIKQMKYEVSMQYMDSAVKYNPDKYQGYRGVLRCVFQKDYKGALVDLLAAQRNFPDGENMDHPWDYWASLCYLQLCMYDSAEAAMERVVKRDAAIGKDWGPYLHSFYYGVALFEREKFAEALAQFELTLTRHKLFADAKYYKALCLKAAGKKEEAIALMEQAERDLKAGHSFDDDSSIYEKFPYQITDWMIAGSLYRLKE
ncbi:MAG TPA: tetratricopeptide repeat protein [Candidatus Kapabacteria bacterium]|nr:tetratricopeptide repeat protein [Candidatus Kapabacteria bacterium]